MITQALRDLGALNCRFWGAGAQSTLRRSNTLQTLVLTVDGGVAQGGAELVATGSDLSGRVVAGSTFSLQGVTGTFTLSADAVAEDGSITLSFAPPLPNALADGVTLTFLQPYADSTFPMMAGSGVERDVEETATGEEIRVLAYKPGSAPAPGDLLDGDYISKVDPIGAGPVTRYRVTVKLGHA